MVRMLIDRGADVNAPRLPRRYLDTRQQSTVLGHAGSTPLHFAAANGHDKIVRILLACGAVQKPDKHGTTPEMVAAEAGHMDVVETLRTWEAMLDEEREKAQEREEEEKKELARRGSYSDASDTHALEDDEDADEDYASPTLGKSSAWKGKGKERQNADRQQRIQIRKSLDHMFGGRRGGSLRVTSGKGDKEGATHDRKRGESLDLNRPADPTNEFVPSKERRTSHTGLFGKVAHPATSLREALHRRSHASDAGTDIHVFRGRTRTQDSDESSTAPPSIRGLSRQSLLYLFRRGAHNGSPPSASPSPPRTTIPNLPTEGLDQSVDRLKRLSVDGIRPATLGNSRPRSASQINFQNPLVSSSIAASDKTDGDAKPRDPVEATGSSVAMQRRSSQPGPGMRPLSRIDTQLANGQSISDDDRKEPPKSILKSRAEGGPSPTSPRGFARLSPWHEPSTPSPLGGSKPRSATLPTSYFSSPLSPRKPEQRKPNPESEADHSRAPGTTSNDESPDFDRREKEDGIGESIWDRAAARKSAKVRSRRASLTSLASSAMSGAPQIPPLPFGKSMLTEPEGTDWTQPIQKPLSRPPSLRRYGRSRNNTVSTVSTLETIDSNLTPPSMSSSQYVSGSSVVPTSEDGLSVKERLVRRVSKRRGDAPDLLYTLPIKSQSEEAHSNTELEKAKYKAIERRRKTEQEILRVVSNSRQGSTVSLAEQLAAYGDIMALEANLSNGAGSQISGASSDNQNKAGAEKPTEQVSRSYIKRPELHTSSSTDSNATIKTENSRVVAKPVRKASGLSGLGPSREASAAGSKTGSADEQEGRPAEGAVQRKSSLRCDGGLLIVSSGGPPLDELFTAHAPPAALPSINRIYETRAAAYRDKGLALMKETPLYGSSAKNPTRPPVKIEDHWLMAGPKQNEQSQGRQQRSVSLGTATLVEETNRPMPPNPAEAATPFRKPSRGFESRIPPPIKHLTRPPGPKMDSIPARPSTGRGMDPSKMLVIENPRRRASASFGNESGASTDTSPGTVKVQEKSLKKPEQGGSSRFGVGGTSDVRKMSADMEQTSTPTSAGSASPVTPLATGHKPHRWGDGLKSAMRLGKSKS